MKLSIVFVLALCACVPAKYPTKEMDCMRSCMISSDPKAANGFLTVYKEDAIHFALICKTNEKLWEACVSQCKSK